MKKKKNFAVIADTIWYTEGSNMGELSQLQQVYLRNGFEVINIETLREDPRYYRMWLKKVRNPNDR